ncbi:MAG: hypothetical protein WD712_03295 [Candidatus Spechtbacterales bacterium]
MEEIKKSLKNNSSQNKGGASLLPGIAVLLAVLLIFSQVFYISFSFKPKWILIKTSSGLRLVKNPEMLKIKAEQIESGLAEAVTPAQGITILANWEDLGKKLVETGVIDEDKFYSLYEEREGLAEYEKKLLEEDKNAEIVINSANANFILNLLWAFGLANKNRILEEGPMTDEKYGGDAGRFASTGGWSLAKGNAMDHYNTHDFVTLTEGEQKLVEEVAKNIYRPCCGNSVYFPDCNHGMAMLGLLELMAAGGATEQQMYDTALGVNSFWFPDTYMTIGKYFAQRGVYWDDVDAKEVLGSLYSSAQGYAQIAREVEPITSGGGGSCGV